jgi:hypothetical protein
LLIAVKRSRCAFREVIMNYPAEKSVCVDSLLLTRILTRTARQSRAGLSGI